MTAKFEYYTEKYGANMANFDAARWGVRLFLGAALFAVAVMFFFWTWQAPSGRISPAILAPSEAPVVVGPTLDAPVVQPQASPTWAAYYAPLTNPFTMKVGTVAQFMLDDGLRCVLVTESPDQVISDFFKEVFVPCE